MIDFSNVDNNPKDFDKEVKDNLEALEREFSKVNLPPVDLPVPPEDLKGREVKKYQKDLRKKYFKERAKSRGKQIMDKHDRINELEQQLAMKPYWKENLFQKKYVQIVIIDDTFNFKIYNRPIIGDVTIVKKRGYYLDPQCVIRFKGRPSLYYYRDNPFPIKFDPSQNKPLVNAEALNKIWNAKIVDQLFSQGGLTTVQKWTVGTIIALGITTVMVLAVLRDGGTQEAFLLFPLLRGVKNGK